MPSFVTQHIQGRAVQIPYFHPHQADLCSLETVSILDLVSASDSVEERRLLLSLSSHGATAEHTFLRSLDGGEET